MEFVIGQPIVVNFTSTGLVTGLTSFPELRIVANGIQVVSPVVTFSEVGGGAYSLTFTPASTGPYAVFIQGSIQARFIVVARDKFSFLQNIEDEAIGSWTWNKGTGVLTVIRQNGSTLGTFTVTDTLDNSSRERVS
jgi:hypothetical protein